MIKIRNMKFLEYPKKIAWWHGTDVLKLHKDMYPNNLGWKFNLQAALHRIFWRIMWRFFDKHFVHDECKKIGLLEFGIPDEMIEVRHTGRTDNVIYKKQPHDGFNVLFYLPKSEKPYRKWIYGAKYLEDLKKLFNHYNFVVADGSLDMSKVYPTIDCYIKISRTKYNTLNRIAEECKANNIKVIHLKSYENEYDYNLYKLWLELIESSSMNIIRQSGEIT